MAFTIFLAEKIFQIESKKQNAPDKPEGFLKINVDTSSVSFNNVNSFSKAVSSPPGCRYWL